MSDQYISDIGAMNRGYDTSAIDSEKTNKQVTYANSKGYQKHAEN